MTINRIVCGVRFLVLFHSQLLRSCWPSLGVAEEMSRIECQPGLAIQGFCFFHLGNATVQIRVCLGRVPVFEKEVAQRCFDHNAFTLKPTGSRPNAK